MHIFDYQFLKSGISGDILGISNIIFDLRARDEIRRKENKAIFRDLKKTAMIASVTGSNAIEGIVTTKQRMNELCQDNAVPVTHNEQEILGYKNVLSEIYSEDFDNDLSQDLIRHFHYQMLSATTREAGQFKKENNWIQERDEHGMIHVRFVPVSAKETPLAIEQWILAYYQARQDTGISGLLLIACLIVDFLCIHPFSDGNGRISRLLTTMLLQKAGFDIGRYISFDSKINDYKYGYYQALKASSDGWHENKNDYTPFIIYFMQILYSCYKDLDEKFINNQTRKLPKNKQVENLLMNTYVPISKEEVQKKLPDISVSTIERVLGKLVKEEKIVKIGSYRNARYKSK